MKNTPTLEQINAAIASLQGAPQQQAQPIEGGRPSLEQVNAAIAKLQPEEVKTGPFGLTPEIAQQYTGLPVKAAVGTMQAIGEDIARPLSKMLGRDIKVPRVISKAAPEATVGEFIAPMMEFSGLGSLLGGAAKAIPGAAALTEGVPGALGRIGGLGAYSAAEAPRGEELKHFILGSLLGVPGEMLSAATKGIGRAMMPKRTPEQISAIQEAAQQIPGRDTPVRLPAGAVLKSTPLMSLESMLERVPLTGMERPAAQINKSMTEYYGDFIKNLEGHGAEDLHKNVFDAINEGYEGALNRHQGALDKFIDLSKQMEKPAKFEHPNMLSARNEALKDIEKTIKEEGAEGLTEDEEAQRAILKRFNPEKYDFNNFERFEKIKKNLNKEARAQRRKGNYDASVLLEDLKDGLRKDMTENTKGHPELENALKEADDIYREEVVPYRYKPGKKKGRQQQTDFLNALNTGKTEKFINKYLGTGKKQDAYQRLQEVLDLSANPEKTKQLLLSHHLKSAITPTGEINPATVLTQMEKLGENQKNILLGPHRENFRTFETLRATLPKTIGVDFDPKTGFKTLKGIATGALGTAGIYHPALIASLLGSARGLSELLRSDLLPAIERMGREGAGRLPTALLAPLVKRRGEE